MDKLTPEQRKKCMKASSKNKGTKPELLLAKYLWALGLRYRKNDRSIFGTPDLSFKRYKIAIFIDGEFWHGKDWDIRKERLQRNREYWIEKIEENIARDVRVDKELRAMGWIPIHFWSKEVLKETEGCVSDILALIIESYEE